MLHINEFQDLRGIPFAFQILCAQGIRHKSGHALLDQSVFEYRLQYLILYLPVQLVLAARHRQDNLRFPGNRFSQSMIRRRITRMEGHYHVHPFCICIICNISHLEAKLLITVLPSKLAAVPDHVLLKIQSDDPDIISPKLMQIIIHGKCQVRLPASEIQDGKLPVTLKLRQDILDKFQETIYLSKFVEFGADDLPLFRHDPQILKKRNRHSFFKDISLLPVMAHIHLLSLILLSLSLYRRSALLTHQHRKYRFCRLHLHLAHILHILLQKGARLPGIHIPVECLTVLKCLDLKHQLLPHEQRAHLHLRRTVFLLWIAEHCRSEFYIQIIL